MSSNAVASLLVVERHEPFRKKLESRLSREGFAVHAVEDAEQMEVALETVSVDVAVLGLQGYGRGGLRFLQRIKQRQPGAEVILLVSGAQLLLSMEGMKQGAYDDLLIPVDMNRLLEKIRAACGRERGP